MVSDVTVNGWIIFGAEYSWFSFALLLQTLFLSFVLASFARVANATRLILVPRETF
ncbi:MAG: hypothetical protein ACRCY3_08120 [Sphingorhabdus sp.]